MSAGFNISLFRKKHGRLVRALAILFLLHAGADLVMPQFFCSSEEVAGIPAERNTPAVLSEPESTTLISDSSLTNSLPGQPEEQEPHEEDCFCCCAHVLPGVAFGGMAALDPTSLPTPLFADSLPSPPLGSTYHPPRFA